MADIFLSIDQTQHGPYTEAQLKAWLRDGTVAPETPAWQEGMADWQPLSAWGLGPSTPLAPRPKAPMPGHRPAPMVRQPYYPPQTAFEPSPALLGYNRAQYFGMTLVSGLLAGGLFGLVLFIAYAYARGREPDPVLTQKVSIAIVVGLGVSAILYLVAVIWVAIKRLRNIGWHGAFVLLSLFPPTAPFMGLALIALPPGFSQDKKLDAIAWIWIVLFVITVGLFVVALFMGILGGFVRFAQEQMQNSRPFPQ
jgi:uncharacterized membrane protein YhaH (DUF805 family)